MDWFDHQIARAATSEAAATVHSQLFQPTTATPTTNVSYERRAAVAKTFTLTVRNQTFYTWDVAIDCAVQSSSVSKQVQSTDLVVRPADSASTTINARLFLNESLDIQGIAATTLLGSRTQSNTTLTTSLKDPPTLRYHECAELSDINIEVAWAHSTSMHGHMVPNLTFEMITLQKAKPSSGIASF
jgi:hypothetical protein